MHVQLLINEYDDDVLYVWCSPPFIEPYRYAGSPRYQRVCQTYIYLLMTAFLCTKLCRLLTQVRVCGQIARVYYVTVMRLGVQSMTARLQVKPGRGSNPKILGVGALPHQSLTLHHRVHFLRSPKPKKYEFHTGLQATFEIYH